MPTVQLLGALNGLIFPKFAGCCLLTYAIGRVLYGYGYSSGGPTGRMAGGLISHIGDVPVSFTCRCLWFMGQFWTGHLWSIYGYILTDCL